MAAKSLGTVLYAERARERKRKRERERERKKERERERACIKFNSTPMLFPKSQIFLIYESDIRHTRIHIFKIA